MRKLQLQLEDLIDQLRQKYAARTPQQKVITVNIGENIKLPKEQRPAINFSARAYNKMRALVDNCDIEIAWHMTVTRTGPLTYQIDDVLMYPQEATGTTVDGCDTRYPLWLCELTDEQHAKLRGQGHSHVNMGVGPSGTDLDNQGELIAHVKDYYIFVIANKQGDLEVCLYDMEAQQIYFDTDIDVTNDNETWAEAQMAKHLLRLKHVTVYPSTTGAVSGKTKKGSTPNGSKEISRLLQPDDDVLTDPYHRDWRDRFHGCY